MPSCGGAGRLGFQTLEGTTFLPALFGCGFPQGRRGRCSCDIALLCCRIAATYCSVDFAPYLHQSTSTMPDPFLLLTGPSRAVVLIDPVTFEVELKAKCKTESEDKVLNFSVFDYRHRHSFEGPPFIITRSAPCKQSELEFAVALLVQSVEATICVKAVRGSWPDHYRGRVIYHTASIRHGGIVLLDTRYGNMSINRYGIVELSRHVVAVESGRQLKVDVVASEVDDDKKSCCGRPS